MTISTDRIIKRVLFNGKDIQLIGEGSDVNRLPQMWNKTVVEIGAIDLKGVTVLPNRWQENNTNLKKVELPEEIETLSDYCFNNCSSLEELILPDRLKNISGISALNGIGVERLVIPPTVTYIANTNQLANCKRLKELIGLRSGPKRTTLSWGSDYVLSGVTTLETLQNFDLRSMSAITVGFIGNNKALANCYLYSISTNIVLTSTALTVESLIHTAKQLINKAGTTSCTLTIGTTNREKIKNIYVKRITNITEEMLADDDLIESKLPCEVCSSTDEGAMLLEDYIFAKNWKLA